MNLLCSIEGCSYLAERNGICSRHNREARKAAAPKSKPARRRIPKVSEEGRERMAIYNAIRELYMREPDNHLCAVHGNIFPMEFLDDVTASDVHHMAGRLGDALYDVRKWLPLCRRCHDWIERNPQLAYEQGWSQLRNANEPHEI